MSLSMKFDIGLIILGLIMIVLNLVTGHMFWVALYTGVVSYLIWDVNETVKESCEAMDLECQSKSKEAEDND